MNELALFAKYWQPGKVKTRLAAQLGDQAASELYRCFVTTLLNRLEACADRRFVVYSPAPSEREFRGLIGDLAWQHRPQADGDLGARLRHDASQSLQGGTTAWVVLGTDSPSIPLDYVDQAFLALERHDVVLGPTDDGGYYLIGLRRDLPDLFRGVHWSTPQVFQQTLERLHAMPDKPTFKILPPWYDIDTVDDLRRLDDELRIESSDDRRLAMLRRRVQRALEA